MNIQAYSIKAQKALQEAQKLVQKNKQQVFHPAHLLSIILKQSNRFIDFILSNADIDPVQLSQKVDNLIQSYPTSNKSRQTYLAPHTTTLLKIAEELAIDLKSTHTDLEHLLLGILHTEDSVAKLLQSQGLTADKVKKALEALSTTQAGNSSKIGGKPKREALTKYTINISQLVLERKIDPVIGREKEVRQVIEILSRRTKNNPVLIGEPGVGKTAIAEGLAQRIIDKDVPDNMLDKVIMRLDLPLLIAGAKYKGQFEERLKAIVRDISEEQDTIILFIDEIHTLIGAGTGGESAMDAANILKPALARGEMHTIGATTLNEYQRYIEQDRALERRFQKVLVEEPSTSATITILRGIKGKYETHHGVRIKDAALVTAAQYAHRYITDRFMPDSAIDLIDQACAKRRIAISSMPPEVENLQRTIHELAIEREAMRREKNKEKEAVIAKKIGALKKSYESLKKQWEQEKKLLQELKKTQKSIEKLQEEAENAEREADYGKVAEIRYGKIPTAEKRIADLNTTINQGQENNHLLKEEVDEEDIIDVVASLTGIPVSKLAKAEKEKLLDLEKELSKYVVGQDEAIKSIANAVRRSRAGIQNPNRPIGSFIFLGSTGVGKTALSQALAQILFDDTKALVRIDLSEYQERHSIHRLIGAPPGYVGYEEGGQLTEAVRRKPHAVILFDEMDKAHPDLFNLLLPVLDEGHLTDNKGRTANFKNTIIIMTSNLGASLLQQTASEHDTNPTINPVKVQQAKEKVIKLLHESVRPEFINRIDQTIVFNPLDESALQAIVKIKLGNIANRLAEQSITIKATPAYESYLARRGYDPQFGARPLERLVQNLLNEIATQILQERIQPNMGILVDMNAKGALTLKTKNK